MVYADDQSSTSDEGGAETQPCFAHPAPRSGVLPLGKGASPWHKGASVALPFPGRGCICSEGSRFLTHLPSTLLFNKHKSTLWARPVP